MTSHFTERTERKWIFRSYKKVGDELTTLEKIDKLLNGFVTETPIQRSLYELIKPS